MLRCDMWMGFDKPRHQDKPNRPVYEETTTPNNIVGSVQVFLLGLRIDHLGRRAWWRDILDIREHVRTIPRIPWPRDRDVFARCDVFTRCDWYRLIQYILATHDYIIFVDALGTRHSGALGIMGNMIWYSISRYTLSTWAIYGNICWLCEQNRLIPRIMGHPDHMGTIWRCILGIKIAWINTIYHETPRPRGQHMAIHNMIRYNILWDTDHTRNIWRYILTM